MKRILDIFRVGIGRDVIVAARRRYQAFDSARWAEKVNGKLSKDTYD